MNDTGLFYTKNNEPVLEGDIIKGKSPDGEIIDYTVTWSQFHLKWIGYHPDEIYDVAPSKLVEFDKVGNIHNYHIKV